MKCRIFALIALAVVLPFSAHCGLIVRYIFDGAGLSSFNNTADPFATFPTIPDRPNRKEVYNGPLQVQGVPLPSTVSGEGFSSLIRGFLIPPQTGEYTFYIRSDDSSKFFLSTDATPANKRLLCREPGANTVWVEDGIHSSSPVTLEAFQNYYFEIQHSEITGGDAITVGWRLPDGIFEAPIRAGGFTSFPLDEVNHTPRSGMSPIIPEGIYHQFPISGHPVDVEVHAGGSATFHVGADGSPPLSFQWRRNGQPITGATSAEYSIPFVSPLDFSARFDVVVTNPQGSVTSRWATVAVPFDNPMNWTVETQLNGQQGMARFAAPVSQSPMLVAALTRGNPNGVDLIFSSAINEVQGSLAANYSIDQGVTIQSARLLNNRTVRLTTSSIEQGKAYTVTVANLQGTGALPKPVPAGTSAAFVQAQNLIERRSYLNIGGNPLQNLLTSGRYPDDPDLVEHVSLFENPEQRFDSFGAGFFGLLIPAVSGNYIFLISGDDTGELLLNATGATPPGIPIARFTGAAGYRTYLADPGLGQPSRVDANNPADTPINHSLPIALTAGTPYYIEGRFKEGGGGDHFSVGWMRLGDKPIVNGDPPIGPANLDLLTPGGPVQIAAPPNLVTPLEGPSYYLAQPTGARPYFYQWLRNGAPLRRQVKQTLALSSLPPEEATGDFSVVVMNHFSSATSQVVRVSAPTSPGFILTQARASSPGSVLLYFTQTLRAESANEPLHYSVSTPDGLVDLEVIAAELLSDQKTVKLTTTSQAGSQLYLVSAENLSSPDGIPVEGPVRALFRAWDLRPGTLKQEIYNGVPTVFLRYLERHPRFPLHPDAEVEIPGFSISANILDNYGSRVTGWITPPFTDLFKFFSEQDDASRVFLSPDADPDKKIKIIDAQQVLGTYTDNAVSSSGPVYLEAGKYYYIEGWMKEQGGGDLFNVGMRPAWETGAPTTLGGNNVAYFSPATQEGIAILQQPQDISVPVGLPATFTVEALGTSPGLTYQWFRDGLFIEGATEARYVTPPVTEEDADAQFSCTVMLGNQTVASETALLSLSEPGESVRLTIQKEANSVTISWPAEALGAVLQSTSSLSPPVQWSDVAGSQTVTTFSEAGAGPAFYRLKQ